jgi:hypothetical protein
MDGVSWDWSRIVAWSCPKSSSGSVGRTLDLFHFRYSASLWHPFLFFVLVLFLSCAASRRFIWSPSLILATCVSSTSCSDFKLLLCSPSSLIFPHIPYPNTTPISPSSSSSSRSCSLDDPHSIHYLDCSTHISTRPFFFLFLLLAGGVCGVSSLCLDQEDPPERTKMDDPHVLSGTVQLS